MASRVLETILTGKNLLSPVLASAARDVESYNADVERANAKTGTSADASASRVVAANTKAARSTGELRDELQRLGKENPNVKVRVDTAGASGDVERFAAETKLKASKAGDDAGGKLSQGMRMAFVRNSPLIAAAVAGGLAVGAPAVIAASALVFGGIAALAASNVGKVQDAFSHLKANVLNNIQGVAEQTAPQFVAMAGSLQRSFNRVAPSIHAALIGVAPELLSMTDAIGGAAGKAIPAFTRAIQQGQPVINGLNALIQDLGKGLAELMDDVSAHAPAAGTALSSVGAILGKLLPILGQLLGSGTELAASVLPPLASALGVVADVLKVLAPILPEVTAGIGAFAVVKTLTGPLELLSAKLQTVAADGGKLTTALAGRGASAVSTFGAALPALGAGLAVLGGLYQAQVSTVNNWAQAIEQGGQQAADAMAEMKRQENASLAPGDWWERAKGLWNDGVAQIKGYANAQDEATQAAKRQYDALSPLGKAQQDVTTAQNDLSYAVGKWGKDSGQAAGAAVAYRDAQARLKLIQEQLTAATKGTSVAEQQNADRLQNVADKASAAQAAINLLKSALDALTGKQVSMTQAEIGVQQAVQNATAAVKGQKGALVDANGQLTVHTARGAAAQAALIALRDASNQLIGTMEQQGATSGQVAAKDAELRAGFIKTAEKMGYTKAQAKQLADQILGIPSKRKVEITADTKAATDAAKAFEAYWNGIKSRKVTLTYDEHHNITSKSFGGVGNAGTTMKAAGGIVHAYADGGIEPMRAGVAEVVHPNTLRVIGDRVTDDEAYIPINRSQRSKAILGETAERMGYRLMAFANGGLAGGLGSLRGNLNRTASNVMYSLTGFLNSGFGKDLTGTSDQVVTGIKNVAAKALAAEKSGAAVRTAAVRKSVADRLAVTRAADSARLTATREANAKRLAAVREANAEHTKAAAHTSSANRGAVARANAARLAAVEDTNRKALAATEAYNRKALAATEARNKRDLATSAAHNKQALDASTRFNRALVAADQPLRNLADQRAKVADQLAAAKAKLTDAIKLRDDYATQVRSSAEQYANLTQVQATRGLPLTSKQIVTDLQTRLAAITKFRANLATLAKSGLSKTAYDEIAQAGVDGGSATAAALVAGGKNAVAQLNTVQGKIDSVSKGLGSDASKTLYQAGVNTAQGLVNGLNAKSAALTQAAKHLAATLTAEVKRELGIRSPSTKAHGIGLNYGQGMVNGLAAMRPAVAAEMRALADTQALSGLSPSSMPGYGAAASPGIDYQRLGQAVAQALQSSGGRSGPVVEMHNPTFGSTGAAQDVTQELAYAARTRGW